MNERTTVGFCNFKILHRITHPFTPSCVPTCSSFRPSVHSLRTFPPHNPPHVAGTHFSLNGPWEAGESSVPQQPIQLVYGRGSGGGGGVGGGGGGVGGGLGLRVVAPDTLLRELVGAALYVDEKRRETEREREREREERVDLCIRCSSYSACTAAQYCLLCTSLVSIDYTGL